MRLTPHPMTLRQLQYVVAVADRRSFRGAAEACRVAAPSLSAQVADLEAALGVKLFERDRRRVAVTAAGTALVARARELLASADALADAARDLGDPFGGTLRIGVIPTVGSYLLPDAAPKLRAAFPRLAVAWVEEKTPVLLERLAKGELDGAVVALDAEVAGLPRVVLGEDPFVFAAAASHPLAASARPIATAQLEGERVLLLDDGHCFRDQALELCARAGAEEAAFRATSLATLVQMAAAGLGVTLLPSLALALENRGGALRVRRFAPTAPSRTLALVWRRGAARDATLERVGATLAAAYAAARVPARAPARRA
ncbi:MAG TPA: LysR substrate-binding domain-containing protein [Planctomycetota bacterium]|nr:LysR substrate-binding domain-containing protein [Planctomycetota bacterium]